MSTAGTGDVYVVYTRSSGWAGPGIDLAVELLFPTKAEAESALKGCEEQLAASAAKRGMGVKSVGITYGVTTLSDYHYQLRADAYGDGEAAARACEDI